MKRPMLAALAVAAAAAAPATASAATINISAPTGTPFITYKAKQGEVNALGMRGTVAPGDRRMAFFEYRARLTAGEGCESGFPVICGLFNVPFPVDVSLGDRSDVANVNSFTSVVSMDAGSGDDDVLAGGLDATADGGSGNDTIRVAANAVARGTGGSGRDRISGGLGAAAAFLDGGSGNDLLVPDGFQLDDAKGGTGDDQLVSSDGREVRLAGDDGSDVLVASGLRVTLDGGDDGDLIFSRSGNVTVNAGSGIDIIDVQGGPETAPDTVSCGSGLDIAWVDDADTIASDCELKLRSDAPEIRKVASAEAAANALLEHIPDPSQR